MNICHKKLTSTTVVSFFPAEMSSPAYVNNGKSRDFLSLLNMDKIGMGVLPQVGAVPHVTHGRIQRGGDPGVWTPPLEFWQKCAYRIREMVLV